MLSIGIEMAFKADKDLSSLATGGMRPIPAPIDRKEYPCITYQGASYADVQTLSGTVGLPTVRIIFDCLAERYGVARRIAELLAKKMDGFVGDLPDGARVSHAEVANIVDRDQDQSGLHCSSVHVLFTYWQ